ncbi:MAG: hypothetical protein ABJE66_23640 [Deltaproteobacteria bacterium]
MFPVTGCKRDRAPSSDPIQIAKRESDAYAALVADGERAKDCAAAAAVMQADFERDRAAFAAAAAQTADLAKVKAITDYAEAHPGEIPDNDARWDELFERCKAMPAMKRLGAEIMFPTGPAVPEPAPEPLH